METTVRRDQDTILVHSSTSLRSRAALPLQPAPPGPHPFPTSCFIPLISLTAQGHRRRVASVSINSSSPRGALPEQHRNSPRLLDPGQNRGLP